MKRFKGFTLCAAALTLAALAGCASTKDATITRGPGGWSVFIPDKPEPVMTTDLAPLTANPLPAPALRTVEK